MSKQKLAVYCVVPAAIAVLAFIYISSTRQPAGTLAKPVAGKSAEDSGAPAGLPVPGKPAERTTATQPVATTASAQTAAQKSAPAKRPHTGIAERTGERRVPLHETMSAMASGVFVSAVGKETAMEPDEIGVFPRQHIEPGKEVTVRVSYPEGAPGDLVVAAVEDGGSLEGGKHTAPLHLDGGRTVAFRFQPTDAPGLFRVTLQKGIDSKVVEMWVGPEPRMQGE